MHTYVVTVYGFRRRWGQSYTVVASSYESATDQGYSAYRREFGESGDSAETCRA